MAATEAFVTMATTDEYCKGAMAVAASLRRHGTTRDIVVMVTVGISEQSRKGLEKLFDEVITVELMDSEDHVRLAVLGRPELGITFTKIHCWTLTQFSKCVFLDADTLVLCNIDELFERDELSAAPDPGWPDCFNSGVFVFKPSLQTHARLLDHARRLGSFDGGDQGLLNSFFSGWPVEDIRKHLPFIYNLSTSSVYSYAPAFQQFGHEAKIVHFLGPDKPWRSSGPDARGVSYLCEDFFSQWWKEYVSASSSSSSSSRQCQQTQIQGPAADTPFSRHFDSSNSLLPHFPSTSEPTHAAPLTIPHVENTPEEMTVMGEIPASTGILEMDEAESTADHSEAPAADRENEELEHRRMWEEGRADYLGRDAFRNIQKLLDSFLDERISETEPEQ
ncbi:glycogenin-2 isoform X2 [Synchiropus splendidus]|uniref:glycogenin-2 isoform X2 n=1 Tax=Synchiropus splendidus TaxID=270530 RepID=UPI00237DE3A1|nr:glycogenin-2 isoform X2 [Synchiropus splendidus]